MSDLLDFVGAELVVSNNVPDHLQEADLTHYKHPLSKIIFKHYFLQSKYFMASCAQYHHVVYPKSSSVFK